jgi:hypothetical protein
MRTARRDSGEKRGNNRGLGGGGWWMLDEYGYARQMSVLLSGWWIDRCVDPDICWKKAGCQVRLPPISYKSCEAAFG